MIARYVASYVIQPLLYMGVIIWADHAGGRDCAGVAIGGIIGVLCAQMDRLQVEIRTLKGAANEGSGEKKGGVTV